MNPNTQTIAQLKLFISALPEEEREQYADVLKSLGLLSKPKPTGPHPSTSRLKEYHLEAILKCLTCPAETSFFYLMKHNPATNELISSERLSSEPEVYHHLRRTTTTTAWCPHCEEYLLTLPKESLIAVIKDRRFYHAKDRRLFKDTRGRLPADGLNEDRGGRDLYPREQQTRSLTVIETFTSLPDEDEDF